MRITRDHQKKSLILDQTKYASKMVKHFSQENCKETSVPLPISYILRPDEEKENSSLYSCYQSVIGFLLYIMLGTRPDIIYAVIKMLQYSSNPSEEHLQKVVIILLIFHCILLISFNTSCHYWRGLHPSNISYLLVVSSTSTFFSHV